MHEQREPFLMKTENPNPSGILSWHFKRDINVNPMRPMRNGESKDLIQRTNFYVLILKYAKTKNSKKLLEFFKNLSEDKRLEVLHYDVVKNLLHACLGNIDLVVTEKIMTII